MQDGGAARAHEGRGSAGQQRAMEQLLAENQRLTLQLEEKQAQQERLRADVKVGCPAVPCSPVTGFFSAFFFFLAVSSVRTDSRSCSNNSRIC